MTGADQRPGLRLSALHAASFAGIGLYLPFFPVWLESRGLDAPTIGVVLAIPILVRIIATVPLLAWADGALGPRRLLIVSHATLAVAYPALLLLHRDWAIATFVALLALAQAPVIPANDLVTTEAVRRRPGLDYGRIRVWGSVAFLATSIAGGWLVGAAGADGILWGLAAAALAGLVSTWAAVPPANGTPRRPGPGAGRDASRLRLSRALWLLMAAAACIQASHAGLYGFGSIHWRDTGLSGATIGLLWATGVLAEIAVFRAFGGAVGRGTAAAHLLMAGAAAAVARFALLATEPGLAATIGLQLLHGLTFGATHLGAMAALSRLAPEAARGRAQGAFSALSALAAAGASVASGLIYRSAGPLVFAAMAPLGAAGLLLALAGARILKAHPHRSGEGG